MMQFGEILRSLELPQSWREEIAELCQNTSHGQDNETERILRRRAELDAEQKRLINLYQKGYVTEQALDEEMERIRAEQLTPAEQERAIMPIRQDMSFR